MPHLMLRKTFRWGNQSSSNPFPTHIRQLASTTSTSSSTTRGSPPSPEVKTLTYPCIEVLGFPKAPLSTKGRCVQYLSLIRASSSFSPTTRSQYKRPRQQIPFQKRAIGVKSQNRSTLYSQVITIHLYPWITWKWGWLLWCERWVHHLRCWHRQTQLPIQKRPIMQDTSGKRGLLPLLHKGRILWSHELVNLCPHRTSSSSFTRFKVQPSQWGISTTLRALSYTINNDYYLNIIEINKPSSFFLELKGQMTVNDDGNW